MNYTLGLHLAIPCTTCSALGSLDLPTDAGCLQRSPVCAWGELDLLSLTGITKFTVTEHVTKGF